MRRCSRPERAHELCPRAPSGRAPGGAALSTGAAAAALPARPARPAEPTRGWVLANVVLMQAGWFACVLGAARGWPALGTLSVAAIVAWHLWRSPRAADEARLVGAVLVLGVVFDGAVLASGAVAYPNGQWVAWLTPHWMLALWALFAVSLNVSLRWLARRWALAALLGAVAGPLSYLAGVRLGAARFIDEALALSLLAVGWALAMPALLALSKRFDGVAAQPDREGHDG